MRFIEQGHEVGPREKTKRGQMLARALRKLGYEVIMKEVEAEGFHLTKQFGHMPFMYVLVFEKQR